MSSNRMSFTQPLASRSEAPLAAVHNSYSFINNSRVDTIQDGTSGVPLTSR